jgi:hypothetical protein
MIIEFLLFSLSKTKQNITPLKTKNFMENIFDRISEYLKKNIKYRKREIVLPYCFYQIVRYKFMNENIDIETYKKSVLEELNVIKNKNTIFDKLRSKSIKVDKSLKKLKNEIKQDKKKNSLIFSFEQTKFIKPNSPTFKNPKSPTIANSNFLSNLEKSKIENGDSTINNEMKNENIQNSFLNISELFGNVNEKLKAYKFLKNEKNKIKRAFEGISSEEDVDESYINFILENKIEDKNDTSSSSNSNSNSDSIVYSQVSKSSPILDTPSHEKINESLSETENLKNINENKKNSSFKNLFDKIFFKNDKNTPTSRKFNNFENNKSIFDLNKEILEKEESSPIIVSNIYQKILNNIENDTNENIEEVIEVNSINLEDMSQTEIENDPKDDKSEIKIIISEPKIEIKKKDLNFKKLKIDVNSSKNEKNEKEEDPSSDEDDEVENEKNKLNDEDIKLLKLKSLKKLYNSTQSKELKILISKLILSSGDKDKPKSIEEIEKDFIKIIEKSKNNELLFTEFDIFNNNMKTIEKIQNIEKDKKINLNENDIKYFCFHIIDNFIDEKYSIYWNNSKYLVRFSKFQNIFS